MASRINQDARAARPLWIIAVSLLTIALCLVLLVVKKHFLDPREDPTTVTLAVEEGATKPPDRIAARNRSYPVRQVPSSPNATDVNESLTVAELTEASSQLVSEGRPPPSDSGGILAAAAHAASTNYTTAIVGRVILRGTPPPEAPIDMSASPPCANLQTNLPATRNFVVGPDGGLANVLVSIVKGLDRKSYLAPRTNLEIAFINCQIQPYVSAGMIGQQWTLKNADAPRHTFQLSKINKSPFLSTPLSPNLRFKSFDPLRFAGVSLWLQPDNLFPITCENHPWESGYVSLFDHPFFAVTDTNGNFVIPNVPPGKYSVRATHPALQSTNSITRETTVHPDKISQVHLPFDAPGS